MRRLTPHEIETLLPEPHRSEYMKASRARKEQPESTDTVADDMVSGLACQQCGQFLSGRAPGHPRTCTDCGGDTRVIDIEDQEDLE